MKNSLNKIIDVLCQVVSDALQKSDFKALEGIVDKDAIASLKTAISKLSVSQRQLLGIQKEDIFYAFPYQVSYIISTHLLCPVLYLNIFFYSDVETYKKEHLFFLLCHQFDY